MKRVLDMLAEDHAIIEAQLREHILTRIYNPALPAAARAATDALNALAAAVADLHPADHHRAHPRITTNLHEIHRRYRRPN